MEFWTELFKLLTAIIVLVTTVIGLLKAKVGKEPTRRVPAPEKAKRKRSR